MKLTTYQRAAQAFEEIIADYLDIEGDEDLAATVERVRKALKAGCVAAKRAERIQWVYAGNDTYVAQVGRRTFRVGFGRGRGSLSVHNGLAWDHVGETGTSVESASRKIRAWRKK